MRSSWMAEEKFILCWCSSLAWRSIYDGLVPRVLFVYFLRKFVTNLNFLYLSGFERCECEVVGSIIFGDNIFVVVRFRKFSLSEDNSYQHSTLLPDAVGLELLSERSVSGQGFASLPQNRNGEEYVCRNLFWKPGLSFSACPSRCNHSWLVILV